MGIFKEVYCAQCGKKTGLLTRTKLKDGQYVCPQCTSSIPSAVQGALSEYTFEDYQDLRKYITESDNELSKVFRENHYFQSIHVDTEQGLFYLGDFVKPFYLKLENLEEFELQYTPDELKEGFLSDKVKGTIYMKLKMSKPYFYKEEILATHVKANVEVKQGLFKKTATYQNPKGMNEFLHFFQSAWNKALEEKYARLADEFVPYKSVYGYIDEEC